MSHHSVDDRKQHIRNCRQLQFAATKPRDPIDPRFILQKGKSGILCKGVLPLRGVQIPAHLEALVDCRCAKLAEAMDAEMRRASQQKKNYKLQKLEKMARRPTLNELVEAIQIQKGSTLTPSDILSFMMWAHPKLEPKIKYSIGEEVCVLVEFVDEVTAVLIKYAPERSRWILTCPETQFVQPSTLAALFITK